ncbi:MAG: F0F1 ATP synthase subunit A [Eubacteriales bacterium]|nr:F0F1 ATP synthase subunit A [Eubacteriales bacterium]
MGENSEVLIRIFGILDVTGEVVMMWIILALIAVISYISTRRLKDRPGVFQNIIEFGVEYLDNFLSDLMEKKKARRYFSFLSSLFVFIIISNYSGLIPGVGMTPVIKAPTSSLSVGIALGLIAFCFLQITGLKMGAKHYFKRFISPIFFMLPLLILDEFIKPASLALRLFGNIFGEETVSHQLYKIMPIGAPILMMALSILFCAIQAIVFTMLVSIYLDEATELE